MNINSKLLGSGRRLFDTIVPPGTTINQRYGGGDSFYHALQAKFSKHYARGMGFLFSYTFSKDIDTDAGGNPGSVSQGVYYVFDNRLNRGLANIDVRHYFVGSYIYDLPVGRDRHWLSNAPGILDAVLGGWEFSGITSMRTGFPLTITTSEALSGGINNRADQLCHNVPVIGSVHKWFDTNCYAVPAFPAGTEVLGTSGRGSVSGPGLINLDLSLDKTFRLGEQRTLEFNASAFNALNMPHFGNPKTNVSNGDFGTITGTYSSFPNRELQLGLKFLF